MISLEKKQSQFCYEIDLAPQIGVSPKQNNNPKLSFDPTTTECISEGSKNSSITSRKSCLRFCRKLMRFTQTFQKSEDFERILKFAFSIIEGLLLNLKFYKYNQHLLMQIQREIHQNFWKALKQKTGSANPKLCLITSDEWNTLFSYAGFSQQIHFFTESYTKFSSAVEFESSIDLELFVSFFTKNQFIVHMIVINTLISQEMYPLYEYLKATDVLDNCMLMANFSNLYLYYNHSKGKFAQECCGKCKVCRSTMLPKDFKHQLEDARYQIKEIRSFFAALMYQPERRNLTTERCLISYNYFSNFLFSKNM